MNFCMDQIDAVEIGILARSGHDTTEVPELVPLMLSRPRSMQTPVGLTLPDAREFDPRKTLSWVPRRNRLDRPSKSLRPSRLHPCVILSYI